MKSKADNFSNRSCASGAFIQACALHEQLTAKEGESPAICAKDAGADNAVVLHFILAGHSALSSDRSSHACRSCATEAARIGLQTLTSTLSASQALWKQT